MVIGVRHWCLTAVVRPPRHHVLGQVIPDSPDGEAYQPREAEDDKYEEREGRPDSGTVNACVNWHLRVSPLSNNCLRGFRTFFPRRRGSSV